ncbi:MAG TPA: hypothetical protein VM324_10755, partial [Egibacteraceae bacterium]|nr:hypothetical protein [Egibacteraceae bacterium]
MDDGQNRTGLPAAALSALVLVAVLIGGGMMLNGGFFGFGTSPQDPRNRVVVVDGFSTAEEAPTAGAPTIAPTADVAAGRSPRSQPSALTSPAPPAPGT